MSLTRHQSYLERSALREAQKAFRDRSRAEVKLEEFLALRVQTVEWWKRLLAILLGLGAMGFAGWSIATGYVATSPAAWATDAMKAHVADFPQAAVARDQLQHAVSEITVHEGQRVMKVFNDNLQAALVETKTPETAMKDAQAEAERILAAYR